MKICQWRLVLSVIVIALCSCTKEGNTYIKSGSSILESTDSFTVEQNTWIYNVMSYYYYWTDDMDDIDSYNLNSSSTFFFESILSDKDRFSWIELNSNYSGSATSLYDQYGLHLQQYLTVSNQEVYRVLYTVAGSSSHNMGFRRGDWIQIDDTSSGGVSLTKGYIERGKYISSGEFIQLESYFGYDPSITYSISVDSIYQIENKNIGYFVYDQFMDSSQTIGNVYRAELRYVFDSFKEAQIDELIIDLRYNPGGYVSICQYLCSLVLSDDFLGGISGYQEYNKYVAQALYESSGSSDEVVYLSSAEDLYNSNIGMQKIYVILTKDSYSASESLVNTLRPFIDVVVVGNNSGGKGVGSFSIADNNYKYQLQPITFRYYNKNYETIPDEGITPDIFADESYEEIIYPLGDTQELLLSKAISDICGQVISDSSNTKSEGGFVLNPIDETSINFRKNNGYIKF